jgi:phosphoadenosine phosphosulfate reductase
MTQNTKNKMTTSISTTFSTEEINALNANLETKSASERIEWAFEQFSEDLVLSTSFGIQSAVMLHLSTSVFPNIPVVFIDTGYLFPETYRFAHQLQERLQLKLKIYTPRTTAAWQEAIHGKRWEQDKKGLEAYNRENKVEPMNRAIQELGAKAWMSGLRRSQSTTRRDLQVLKGQNKTLKIHPIIEWTEKDIYYYMKKHDLPFHPLWDQGYVSVGDWHSSAPLEAGMTAEATRFNGVKRECGLHELSGDSDWQI